MGTVKEIELWEMKRREGDEEEERVVSPLPLLLRSVDKFTNGLVFGETEGYGGEMRWRA